MISEPPDAHAPNIFAYYGSNEVEYLTRDNPSDPKMTTPRRERHHPAPLVTTLAFCQNITPIREIVQDNADLRWLNLALSAGFGDAALLVQELAQDVLVEILKH